MDLHEKIRTLPTQPGVYLYKNPEGEVIYVGKAKNLRSRVRSYLLEASQANAKTGSLMREAVDIEYILVANEHEALALENNLIKQRKPRFNILLRDDKTYPYVKLTLADRYPKVFVTRRLRKDGSAYYGPYFPGNLAYRIVELIHRSFLIPSCKVDLSRYHPRACLQYYIHRCLGPCVEDFTTPEAYAHAVRDAQLFLEGRSAELERSLALRMNAAAEAQQFEAAARLRDQLSTVHQLQEKQRIATTEQGDDADVFGYHFEAGSLAVNLFHVRAGKIVDRREFFWDDLPDLLETPISDPLESGENAGALNSDCHPERALNSDCHPERAQRVEGPASCSPAERATPEPQFRAGAVFSALLKQLYIDQQYVPRSILVPTDFDDRENLAALLTERTGHRIEIAVPQRGEKRSLIDLAGQNAKQSYTQRFRVLEPSRKAIQEALADTLMLPELPRRIECFDISHIQGAETVASLVVWEDGKMNKQLYRKFKVMTVLGVDDFASMREVVHRRYRRLLDESGNKVEAVLAAEQTLPHISRDVSRDASEHETTPFGETQAEPRLASGHDFSRAKNSPLDKGVLAPADKPSREPKTLPSLILIDGGLGQLHAAAEALEALGLTSQPLASIAKREEVIYLYGNEDEPIVLDRRSPVLHLIQVIRDESHRFAVGYHRQRRAMRDRDSELLNIPGVGAQTRQRLLSHFGSLRDVQQATAESLASVVPRKTAEAIWRHFHSANIPIPAQPNP
jgi:excinuclease ABC subunit C